MPFFLRRALVLLMAWLTGALVLAAPPEKTIHLRNERIATPPKAVEAAKAAPAELPPGLRLIQCETTPTPEQRTALAALGVELLAYVPDDAFIADPGDVTPAQLRALPFVRWVGAYRPDH